MAVVTYLRVSTLEQTIENQRQQIDKKGFIVDREFSDEGFTGINIERKGFKECMNYLRGGDKLVVYSLSRLARSTKDLLNIIEELQKKGVEIISISENIDTQTATGKLLLGIIAAVNQFEVESLRERQLAGIERAKQDGKYKGRKEISKPKNWQEIYSDYMNRKITAKKAMEILNLKKNTFYKFTKENN